MLHLKGVVGESVLHGRQAAMVSGDMSILKSTMSPRSMATRQQAIEPSRLALSSDQMTCTVKRSSVLLCQSNKQLALSSEQMTCSVNRWNDVLYSAIKQLALQPLRPEERTPPQHVCLSCRLESRTHGSFCLSVTRDEKCCISSASSNVASALLHHDVMCLYCS